MGHTARLHIIRDRFVAGHDSCELRRHLDSVAPETPIREIVDHCRVWESHADSDNRRFGRPGPERALPIYTVDDVGGGRDGRVMADVTTSLTAPDQLETLLKRLFPTPVVPPPQTQPGPVRRDWAIVVCFSCGKPGHGATQCPALNEAFPSMLPGWKADML